MAKINFDNIIIDRVLSFIFESSDGKILGGLNQLQNVSLETSAENKDKVDSLGTLIKRFYTGKTVTISGDNVVFSTSLAALQFGTTREVAGAGKTLVMPRIITINTDTIAEIDGATEGDPKIKKYTLPEAPIDGTIIVCACDDSGVPDPDMQYTLGAAASESEFVLSDKDLTLPTGITGKVVIKYERIVEDDGVKITQTATKFPKSCKATLSVLVCDTCDNEIMRQAYIVVPSFQMDPNHTLSFNTEDPQSFTGVAQKDYCSADGELYSIFMSADDIAA